MYLNTILCKFVELGTMLFSAVALLTTVSASSVGPKSSSFDAILRQGVRDRVYPGASAMAGDAENNIYYSGAVGSHMYPGNDDAVQGKTTVDTWFDLASVSKVISTTSATALLYQMGYISLDDRISSLMAEPENVVMDSEQSGSFAVNGKESITVKNCLLHNAGFTPDHEPYWYAIGFAPTYCKRLS
jgi:serine-type D-Ala-D-Ala carboxypeptidase